MRKEMGEEDKGRGWRIVEDNGRHKKTKKHILAGSDRDYTCLDCIGYFGIVSCLSGMELPFFHLALVLFG